jgi:hypothetical protein
VMLIGRRRAVVAAAGGATPAPEPVQGSPEEMERLRQALSEADDR